MPGTGTSIADAEVMSEWLAALENTGFATWLRESGSIWAYPTVLTLHTAGMVMLVGMNWTLDLRILGVAPGVPLRSLDTLFRAMWIGFWINFVTGVMLFAADATTKGSTSLFMLKLGLVVLAVLASVLMRRSINRPEAPSRSIPVGARVYASVSLALWVAAIAAGRMMAYV
jgi:hypothetical protein